MERIGEEVMDSDLKYYINFLSMNKWRYKDAYLIAMQRLNKASENKKRSGRPIGLIIYEKYHLKNVKKSLYELHVNMPGLLGEVDNCQISVHISLSNERFGILIENVLFLLSGLTKDKTTC